MLHIKVNGGEFFSDELQEFITIKSQKLTMEHSLLSLSKWESKWKVPFLSETDKTPEQYLDYIKCMTITSNVDDLVYKCLSGQNFETIRRYINDPYTATTIKIRQFPGYPKNMRRQVITSELIYYWMIGNNIPVEFEKWHLNRLMTLIHLCSIKNNPNRKKMSRNEIYQQNSELNRLRRAKYHTKG